MKMGPEYYRTHIEDYIRERGKHYGFDRVVVVGKDDFIDLQVMVLPEFLRGQGRGSRFMDDICAEADRQRQVLALYAEPAVTGWTADDKKRLARWYERYGFVRSSDHDVYRGRHVRMSGTDRQQSTLRQLSR